MLIFTVRAVSKKLL